MPMRTLTICPSFGMRVCDRNEQNASVSYCYNLLLNL
jgi:hypothetical protein